MFTQVSDTLKTSSKKICKYIYIYIYQKWFVNKS